MSAQTMAEAFAPTEADHKRRVIESTWGHLAPSKDRPYSGSIVFAVGCFGSDQLNPTILSCHFRGLSDSPWLFQSITEFIAKCKNKAGCVYQFNGTFKNYIFKGKIQKVFQTR